MLRTHFSFPNMILTNVTPQRRTNFLSLYGAPLKTVVRAKNESSRILTLDRIIAAEGTFTKDDGKKIRHGVREAAQKAAEAEAEAAPAVAEEGKYSKMVDPRLVERFHQAFDQVLKKEIDVPLQFEADYIFLNT